MKTVCLLNKCNSCTACVSICPTNAIYLQSDIDKSNCFIDTKKCINCHLCEKVCPNISRLDYKDNIDVLNAFVKKDVERNKSSSGGIASAITYDFIRKGGYVAGVIYDKKAKSFNYIVTNNINQAKLFAGSKYVKCNLNKVYNEVINLLKNSNKVLFIGTPCYVAGIINLASILKVKEKLYTIDLICHGTPSQQLFFDFIKKYKIDEKVDTFYFRNHAVMQVFVNDFKPLIKYRVIDPYMIGFLNGLFYTENCYECNFACEKRVSNITLGDAWESEGVSNGLNLVIVNDENGLTLLKNINNQIEIKKANFEEAKNHNGQLIRPYSLTKKRSIFFKQFNHKNFNILVFKLFPKISLKQLIKKILLK